MFEIPIGTASWPLPLYIQSYDVTLTLNLLYNVTLTLNLLHTIMYTYSDFTTQRSYSNFTIRCYTYPDFAVGKFSFERKSVKLLLRSLQQFQLKKPHPDHMMNILQRYTYSDFTTLHLLWFYNITLTLILQHYTYSDFTTLHLLWFYVSLTLILLSASSLSRARALSCCCVLSSNSSWLRRSFSRPCLCSLSCCSRRSCSLFRRSSCSRFSVSSSRSLGK
jgi:hypothetical protein